MKKIKLLVELNVPDNYYIDEPDWVLEDAVNGSSNIEITGITIKD